ncbi:cation/H+ exchanger protein 1 isoform X2 [Dunckerocampus dactyliophorus]|uniref:cation/H+ exchanger protein 1 isoform X2 n=1 Tax=Dunckerocampus dactyliophorus TaxID=161453 RepID=UPI0024058339|nr:cation/H+ exchanger protein 1 isoform X2 [Dunckerocampus dactyliophorus]
MNHRKSTLVPGGDPGENLRRRSTVDSTDDPELNPQFPRQPSQTERLCMGLQHPDIAVTPAETPSPDASSHHPCHYTPKCFLAVHRACTGGHRNSARSTPSRYGEEGWHDSTSKTTIRADNEVEAHREANNYKFGFRKWIGNVTERPIEDRSDVVRELYSDLSIIKPQGGSALSFGNIVYVLLFGWWMSLTYVLVCPVMFLTIIGAPYGKLCLKLAWYFIWPFGKSVEKAGDLSRQPTMKPPRCEVIPEERDSEDSRDTLGEKDSGPLLMSSPLPIEMPVPELPVRSSSKHWCRVSTYIWLLLGYPVLVVVHAVACVLSWLLVFTIPVSKMNARTLAVVLLMAPEDVHIHTLEKTLRCEARVVLCCYRAVNVYYYKYTVQGINIFALNLLPLVIITLIFGYADKSHKYFSSETKFATAITSIIPLSYYIGMGIASISAQSNFAVGAVVNATFGSITEMTFYITALLQGQRAASRCYEEIVKAALTGTLLGCILFIPGICMIIGGIKHREQRFNSRSAGVSSALLFISIGGVFAPTLFSKTFGNMVCESCSNIPGNASVSFVCRDCHYDTSKSDPQLIMSHIEPLVYTISVLLPAAYLIGLVFALKTHSHIYDIHISDGQGAHPNTQYIGAAGEGGAAGPLLAANSCINASIVATTSHVAAGHHVVHWSRWRALAVLIVATVLMACCADLSTENIAPMLTHSSISQYFIGVTVLAMVPELPEIVNGIQFALQNNISLSLEVGSCIAVQVCMIQIPLLILFNAFYDVGFVLLFSDIHLWASIFSVILVNYIFMDGKCDYFQGTALVVVYLILLAVYFFAPSPRSC